MIFFINVLRAFAAILITNSHYGIVYPISAIASGGLLGDVLFFAVSGFCLTDIKENFPKWYLKRIFRIFPALWIITFVYVLFGIYAVGDITEFMKMFIFPTNYHFIASIMLIYILYYYVMKLEKLKKNIPAVFIGIVAVQLFIYIFFYDKSFYHIDSVSEPMIRLLFFEAMLVGAYVKMNSERFINKNRVFNWVCTFILIITYFGTKIIFSKFDEIAEYQIINQYVLILLLVSLLISFAGIDSLLSNFNKTIKEGINFISNRTLEIYLVQTVLIEMIARKITVFPINWIVITSVIILFATILHLFSTKIKRILDNKFFRKKVSYDK